MKKDTLETQLLAKLQQDVLSDAAIDYVLGKVEKEIGKRFAVVGGELETMRRRKATLETELENLQRMCADGFDSPTIRAGITTREGELSALTSKTLGRTKGCVHKQVVGLRKFVRESLGAMRKLLTGKHSDPAIVRQELARHIDAITLHPKGSDIRYKGEWKMLGEVKSAEGQS